MQESSAEEEEEQLLIKVSLSRNSSGIVGENAKVFLTMRSFWPRLGFSMERLFSLVLDKQGETIESVT